MAKTIVKRSSPNLSGQPSVEFRKDDFSAVIWNKGYDVVIERAFQCPCKTHDNQPLSNCRNCLGSGWIFINPIETKAIITSINKDTKYKSWSSELAGTVSITAMESDNFSFMDRITLKNSDTIKNTSIYSDILLVRDSDTQSPFSFLTYRPINIIGIWVFDDSNKPLLALDEIAYSINETNPYILDFNFNFSTLDNFNGAISILYEHELQYHVQDMPHSVRNSIIVNDDGKQEQILLPVNAYAKLAHNIFDISNRDGSGIIDNSLTEPDRIYYGTVLNNNDVINNRTLILRL